MQLKLSKKRWEVFIYGHYGNVNQTFNQNGLIFAFVIIGITNFIAYKFAGLSKGRIHGSAVAIFFGLILAYIGGGAKGLASIPLFAGLV